jgi:hypothetical protein
VSHDDRNIKDVIEENATLKRELLLLGRDPSMFEDLSPREMNVRLKRSLVYAEQTQEATLLGKEPPPAFLDPMSPHWIPDIEDMASLNAAEFLGAEIDLPDDAMLSDAEVERRLHAIIDRLAEHGMALGIRESVPERLAYRYLVEELREGLDVMPGLVYDGCSGCCEECFQLPYCESGKDFAAEYHFPMPDPPLPPRRTTRDGARAARSYWRDPAFDVSDPGEDSDSCSDTDFTDELPF